MAPSTSGLALDAPCVTPQAATTTRAVRRTTNRRGTTASLRGGSLPKCHAQLSELLLQLRRRRVPVVDVNGLAVRRDDDRGRQRVDVEPVRELAIGDRINALHANLTELRERRLLVRLADGATLAGEVKDVRLLRRAGRREHGDPLRPPGSE